MYLGEVCILTRDVPKLAAFYKALLQTDNGSGDAAHQIVLSTEPMLTIMHEDIPEGTPQRMCVAFTVEDMDEAYAHVLSIGAEVVEPPTQRPWGAVNMILRDPDGNLVYLRRLP